MSGNTRVPAQTDYEGWLRQGYAEAIWSPDDPSHLRQAFLAGWTRGAVYVAEHVAAEVGPASLPKAMADHLIEARQEQPQPGR